MSSSPRALFPGLLFTLLLWSLCAFPAAADWLVLLDGRVIETREAWVIEDGTLTYFDVEGQEHSIPADTVDLEGSAETTAMKKGLPYEPPPKVAPPPAPARAAVAGKFPALNTPGRAPVILYATSWCGYCRKARALLKDLDVDFEEKDIEQDRAAAREMAKKVGGQSGVPVLDIGGQILRGYSDRQIRRLVKDLHAAMKQAS